MYIYIYSACVCVPTLASIYEADRSNWAHCSVPLTQQRAPPDGDVSPCCSDTSPRQCGLAPDSCRKVPEPLSSVGATPKHPLLLPHCMQDTGSERGKEGGGLLRRRLWDDNDLLLMPPLSPTSADVSPVATGLRRAFSDPQLNRC